MDGEANVIGGGSAFDVTTSIRDPGKAGALACLSWRLATILNGSEMLRETPATAGGAPALPGSSRSLLS